ncbi:hypothetical protein, partial [Streptomyces sp. 900105245]
MEDLERYLHTGDGRDLPPLAPATLPPPPGADAAGTARLALLRWFRYLHLPGVSGLLEFRAAVQLAGALDRVPEPWRWPWEWRAPGPAGVPAERHRPRRPHSPGH